MSTIHDIMHPRPLHYPLGTAEVFCNICDQPVDGVQQVNILLQYERDCERRVGLVLVPIVITVGVVAGLLAFAWYVHRFNVYNTVFDFVFVAILGIGLAGSVAALATDFVMGEIVRPRLMRSIRKEIKDSLGYREKLTYTIEAGTRLSAEWNKANASPK